MWLTEVHVPKLELNAAVSEPERLSRPLIEYAPAALKNGWKVAARVKKIPAIKKGCRIRIVLFEVRRE
jgi:hypothetical protein